MSGAGGGCSDLGSGAVAEVAAVEHAAVAAEVAQHHHPPIQPARSFEVPFNIWCEKCGEHIAKGERFNAEKKQAGSYHSTKIWEFAMRHHCGSRIVITTDPKNAEYLVTAGARRKVESYDPSDAGLISLPDEAEREAVRSDPLASLERTTVQARAAATGRAQLVALAAEREDKRDGYALNKQLRAALRASKKADARLDSRWVGFKAWGFVFAAVSGLHCPPCPPPLAPTNQHHTHTPPPQAPRARPRRLDHPAARVGGRRRGGAPRPLRRRRPPQV